MPALETLPTVHETVVADRREAAPGVVILELHAPGLSASARPGHFVMAIPPGGESAATALAIYEAAGERISLMLVVVGPRTAEIARLVPGNALHLAGPLGNGFDCAALGSDVALVAGGVGLASLYLLARELVARQAHVTLFYGARTAASLVDADKYERLGVDVALATDDGSRGFHGRVTNMPALAARNGGTIAACGPSPMLRAVAGLAASKGIRAQLSLEETFACGVGACWGCVVGLDRSSAQAPKFPLPAPGEDRTYVHARICTEGPVFWAHELRW